MQHNIQKQKDKSVSMALDRSSLTKRTKIDNTSSRETEGL